MSKSGRVNAFYQDGQLVTELGDDVNRSVFLDKGHFLGHLASGDKQTSSVSAVDSGNTVMAKLQANGLARFSYTPYGNRARPNGPDTPWAYHGERLDTRLDGYLLGNGYRLYRPALMRFGAPDNMSPFGQGMLNPYAYCMGDPVNQRDPSGHFPVRVLYKYAVPITIAASLTTVATGTALAVVGHLKKDNKLISAAAGVYVGLIMLVGPPVVWGIAMSWRRITSSFMTRDRPRAQTATRRENISRSTRQSLHPNQPPVNSDLIPYVGSTERSLPNRNSGPPEHIELQHINHEVRQPDAQ
ncbi:RHS repeat-associated core domain-containing protein [Pseudomonas fulva]|uniref:RHS repeat-associated core domain-containing protein n=1 Tax=Pseudomonas fulva TaxID=47880 RepID=UPI0018AA3AA1|nr:RHS repeat-associated core domain-containing protein [Pseudomonas fulva]MBF8673175.1 RHS repeat-associated core domain-containing protein [Pseudomonas fulva]MBF8695434.1 RHS repeat-associated core domain-containing protein [Pseudomonas fulva]